MQDRFSCLLELSISNISLLKKKRDKTDFGSLDVTIDQQDPTPGILQVENFFRREQTYQMRA